MASEVTASRHGLAITSADRIPTGEKFDYQRHFHC